MKTNAGFLACIFAALLAGYWLSQQTHADDARRPRPAVRWIAGAAKNALWLLLLTQGPPDKHESVAECRVGSDGYLCVNHGKGW